MSGESPKKIGRGYERNLDAGQFQPMIDSWDLHLRAEKKSAKTIRTYLEAAQWFAAEYLIPAGFTGWDGVRAKQVQEWTVTLLGRYSDSYANNQFRALQQFFKWHATEDPDEQRPNPMAGLKPPKIGDKLVPVFTDGELAALLGTCKGGGFQNRRDYAVISVFKDTGARLSELAGLTTDDISPRDREAVVTGKGDKQRTIRFTYDTARALDRYQRERAKHKMARVSALWLGVRGGPMTASGVYQMIERRGRDAGVEVNPHKFRHILSATSSCRDGRDEPASGTAASARGYLFLAAAFRRILRDGIALRQPSQLQHESSAHGECGEKSHFQPRLPRPGRRRR
jgi:integrase/recombinase XerD